MELPLRKPPKLRRGAGIQAATVFRAEPSLVSRRKITWYQKIQAHERFLKSVSGPSCPRAGLCAPKEELRLLAANFKVVREEVVIPTSP